MILVNLLTLQPKHPFLEIIEVSNDGKTIRNHKTPPVSIEKIGDNNSTSFQLKFDHPQSILEPNYAQQQMQIDNVTRHDLYKNSVIELRTHRTEFALEISEIPRISALTRWQLKNDD